MGFKKPGMKEKIFKKKLNEKYILQGCLTPKFHFNYIYYFI